MYWNQLLVRIWEKRIKCLLQNWNGRTIFPMQRWKLAHLLEGIDIYCTLNLTHLIREFLLKKLTDHVKNTKSVLPLVLTGTQTFSYQHSASKCRCEWKRKVSDSFKVDCGSTASSALLQKERLWSVNFSFYRKHWCDLSFLTESNISQLEAQSMLD